LYPKVEIDPEPMARRKHKPQRTCITCRETKDKRELVRVVRTPAGDVVIDLSGKANGRGAYLCKQPDCWEKGLRKERLAESLKVTLSPQEISALHASLQSELSKV
jgi:predicted RNA-binding protein YlxR (DUF448 family)